MGFVNPNGNVLTAEQGERLSEKKRLGAITYLTHFSFSSFLANTTTDPRAVREELSPSSALRSLSRRASSKLNVAEGLPVRT